MRKRRIFDSPNVSTKTKGPVSPVLKISCGRPAEGINTHRKSRNFGPYFVPTPQKTVFSPPNMVFALNKRAYIRHFVTVFTFKWVQITSLNLIALGT